MREALEVVISTLPDSWGNEPAPEQLTQDAAERLRVKLQDRIANAWPQVAAVVAVRPAPDQITAHCDDPSRAEEIEAVVTEWQEELWPEALNEALAGHRLAYLRARGKLA